MQKKKVGYALFVGAAAVLCILPTVVIPWQTATAVGNERLASAPELLDENGTFNTSILNDFSDYFSDHFGFRHEMITANDTLTGKVLQALDSDSVLLGRNGWLFYRSTEEDYTGANLFTQRQSYAAARVLALMQEFCEQNGIQFCFTVAPNKNSLYNSKMPARYQAAQTRNIQLLTQQLEQQGVQYADLYGVLSAQDEQLYYRLDSHWNMQGAQLAAQALVQKLGGTAVDFDALKTGGTQPHTGDLYEMVYPAGTETEQDAAYDFSYVYGDGFRTADDITIHTTNASAQGSIFVYRDSFGINLHPFLAQSYGKACFFRNMPYRLTAVLEEEPDTLLVEIVERNLNWLLERAPELPAPQRTPEAAQPTGRTVAAQSSDSRMDGYFCLSADLADAAVDDDSPIYILAGEQMYEASPCGDGQQPFTVYLPLALQDQALSVAYRSGGQLVSDTINK